MLSSLMKASPAFMRRRVTWALNSIKNPNPGPLFFSLSTPMKPFAVNIQPTKIMNVVAASDPTCCHVLPDLAFETPKKTQQFVEGVQNSHWVFVRRNKRVHVVLGFFFSAARRRLIECWPLTSSDPSDLSDKFSQKSSADLPPHTAARKPAVLSFNTKHSMTVMSVKMNASRASTATCSKFILPNDKLAFLYIMAMHYVLKCIFSWKNHMYGSQPHL